MKTLKYYVVKTGIFIGDKFDNMTLALPLSFIMLPIFFVPFISHYSLSFMGGGFRLFWDLAVVCLWFLLNVSLINYGDKNREWIKSIDNTSTMSVEARAEYQSPVKNRNRRK